MTGSSEPVVTVGEPRILSPHSKAVYEAGKTILVESIEVGRDFCKFMMGSSAGAIPVYLGLLKFLLPERYLLTASQGVLFAGPTLIFLGASAVFAIGFFPTRSTISLDLPADIERARTESIDRRRKFAFWGFIVFAVATVAAIGACVFAITQPVAVAP